jgi:hypothetical protein
MIDHVLNRGNGRMRILHNREDVAALERVLGEEHERSPVELFTYCVMSNIGNWFCGPRWTRPSVARWDGQENCKVQREGVRTGSDLNS